MDSHLDNKNQFGLGNSITGLNSERDLLGTVSVDSVKVRCPKCYQPYKVYASDISEPRPRFSCRKCDCRFWLPFPEALNKSEQIGFPVSWLNVKSERDERAPTSPIHGAESTEFMRTCSNCGGRHSIDLKECPHCQVVVAKADAQARDEREGVKSTPKLRDLWQQILADFEDNSGHEEFLLEAENQQCMEYATKRYAELEDAMGPDEKILEMKKKLEVMRTQTASNQVQAPASAPVVVKKKRNLWATFSNFILVLSGIVCVVGMTLPGGKNMVGVGAAIAFFSLSLRLVQKK